MSAPLLFVLRAIGLGDFLVGVPAYRALRRAYPEHELRLATTPGGAALARLVGGIDSIAPARGPEAFAVPSRAPEVAVNLHGRGPQSTNALRALRPTRLLSFRASRDAEPGWPVWDDGYPGHERQRWCDLLRTFGIPADAGDFRLAHPPNASPVPGVVVIHPGAAYASRRWPAMRFAAVAARLARSGHDVVVTGGGCERAIAEHVAEIGHLPTSAVLAGTTDVPGLATLVADAALLVTGDTGPAHLATAFGTPSVVLFGPTPPHRWGPPPSPHHVALWHRVERPGEADPWGDAVDPALLEITVDEVAAQAERLLAARLSRPVPAARPR